MEMDTAVVSIAAVFFNKTASITAIYGQETLH